MAESYAPKHPIKVFIANVEAELLYKKAQIWIERKQSWSLSTKLSPQQSHQNFYRSLIFRFQLSAMIRKSRGTDLYRI